MKTVKRGALALLLTLTLCLGALPLALRRHRLARRRKMQE